MSKGINRIKREIAPKTILPELGAAIVAGQSWKQGDLLYFDDTNNLVKPITVETQAATLLGLAQQSITNGVMDGPYTGLTDTSPSNPILAGPVYGVEVEMNLKDGDAVSIGDRLFATTDPTIVSVTGTKEIGVYTGNKNISAGTGLKLNMHLGSRFPLDTLRF